MSGKLNEFLAYLEGVVGNGIYVLGGQTQVVRNGKVWKSDSFTTCYGTLADWLENKAKQSASNQKIILNFYAKLMQTHKDEDVLRIVDCSGLGMNWLQNISGTYSSDMTANGMYGKCEKLGVNELKKGDWVFQVYTSGSSKGKAHHIGYVVDDNLNVVESKGKAYGVVKNAFSSTYWNAYGRPKVFKAEIEDNEEKVLLHFDRVLKKTNPLMSGDDVKALQYLLNTVDGAGLAEDGKCGNLTVKAIKAFQKTRGLKVDGKAGKNTITALGGTWNG